jgi:Predicted nucleotide-binding protein containing TIR-like domain
MATPTPEEAARAVLRALFEIEMDGKEIAGLAAVLGYGVLGHTGLDPASINDAVDLLESRRLAKVIRSEGGRAGDEWRFRSVMPTPEGKREYELMKREKNMDPRKVFVIHGRDLRARDAMFKLLRALDLKPIEWDKAVEMTGVGSPYTGQVLETVFRQVQAVVALFTGDDVASLRPELLRQGEMRESPTPQPRPNVLLESGMALGSHPDRTVIVHAGRLRPISDLIGRHVVVVERGRPWRQEIADRLRTAKCSVDTDHHRDWENEGAELEEAGARGDAPALPAASPASVELGTPDEQALLFRTAVEAQCRAKGHQPVTLKLREERNGTQWAGLDETTLGGELRKMAAQELIEIVSEAGTVFVVKRPVQRVSVVSETERGW